VDACRVEFRNVGQFNRIGRYPLHWHHNGDDSDSNSSIV